MSAPRNNYHRRARRNLAAARKLWTDPEAYTDEVCVNLQQATEKYMKAALQLCGVRVDLHHDLQQFLVQLAKIDSTWERYTTEILQLTTYYELQYDMMSVGIDTAQEALAMAERVAEFAESWIAARN